MSRFFRLLRKDLESSRWPLGILSALIIGFMLLVLFKLPPIGVSDWEMVALALALPLMFLPLWLIWQSFQTLRAEWREDTVYTLLVLPLPGWQVMLSKLAGIWVEYTVLMAVTIGGALLIFGNLLRSLFSVLPSLSWLVRNGLLLFIISLAMLASVVIFVQLAFVVSKMIGRLQGLVAIWTLILSGWLVDKVGILLEPAFRWVPSLPLHKVFQLQELRPDVVVEWNLGPEIGVWLGVLALFALTSYLFEHYIEVNG